MTLDMEAIRADFPILSRKVSGGKDLVYLDNAATTQKPQSVIDAMTHYYERSNANVHRAVHTLAAEATEQYENARDTLAAWFGTTRDNMIFTSGTTEAINLVAWGWARSNLNAGDAIVITEMEHHADIVPWQLLAEEKGIEIRVVPIDTERDILDMDVFSASLPGSSLVCVVHTSNVLGVANPVADIIAQSHDAGAKVLIDAAQAALLAVILARGWRVSRCTATGHGGGLAAAGGRRRVVAGGHHRLHDAAAQRHHCCKQQQNAPGGQTLSDGTHDP